MKHRTRSKAWYFLLLIPIVASLWAPFYNSVEPTWHGIPFFYWCQLLWIVLGAAITAVVYVVSE